MKVYKKNGKENLIVNNRRTDNDFVIGEMLPSNLDNIYFDENDKSKCGIRFGIFSYNDRQNIGFIGFYNTWICLQIQIAGGSDLHIRLKYGGQPWTNWKQII